MIKVEPATMHSGEAGNDKVFGEDDKIWGDAGNDKLRGGAGDDTVVGDGNDTEMSRRRCIGDSGDDKVDEGDDKVKRGGSGDDKIGNDKGEDDKVAK